MIPFQIAIRHVCLGLTMLSVMVGIGCGKSAELPEVIIERARILMEHDRAAEAIPLLSQAVSEMPDSAEARYQRGVAYESLGVLDKALVDYTECLRLNGNRTDALNNKAVVLAKMERFEDAAVEFGRLIDIDPQQALSWRNRGLCHVDLGNFDAALADYARALELAPNDPAGWFQRGGVYLKQGRFDDAEQDYTKAIEADPKLAKAWMNRGVARYKRGEKKLAAEDLKKAQALDDNIVLPDIDFFENASPSAAAAEIVTNALWPDCRSVAEKELTDRGFANLMLVREHPSQMCAEFAGDVNGHRCTILVTCRPEGQDFLTLPSIDSVQEESAADCALLIIRVSGEPDGHPLVSRFEDHWSAP